MKCDLCEREGEVEIHGGFSTLYGLGPLTQVVLKPGWLCRQHYQGPDAEKAVDEAWERNR